MRDGLFEEDCNDDYSELLPISTFVIEGILVPEVFRIVF